jgi:hypothetical protein
MKKTNHLMTIMGGFEVMNELRRGIAWFLIPADIGEIVEKNPGDQLVFIMEMIIKGRRSGAAASAEVDNADFFQGNGFQHGFQLLRKHEFCSILHGHRMAPFFSYDIAIP